MPEQTATTTAGLAGLSGNELARARRAMLSQGGKKGIGLAAAKRQAPERRAPASAPAQAASLAAPAEPTAPTASEEMTAPASNEEIIDSLCAIVEQTPEASGDGASNGRELCRQRRQALSTQGKAALPRQPGGSGNGARRGQSEPRNGQEIARKRRAELSRNGRGDAPQTRPSGRVRPQSGEAPAKVETGTTLSGGTVTGTQVERSTRVTGSESGTCRAVTGTEYIGSEQFETFCATRPAPAPAKVGMSATSRGQWVSGTEVSRATQVTGGESGTCRPVTGTEYLGSENFAEFCEGKGLAPRPEKVAIGATERKGIAISGSDEARVGNAGIRATGGEAGAKRGITGSQYNDAGVARLTINGPSKVALTHTVAGRPVSGTEVGRSIKVTGDEAGSCRTISGTEYLSNEQFQSICQTRPEPGPAKVEQDSSRGGERITGNRVDRSEKVTGNEPGAFERVTGSQYGQGGPRGNAPDKVRQMHTLAGRSLSGSRVDHGPKLSGDEHGGCQPVTGTEYYGQEHYQAYCSGTPAPVFPAAGKVGLSQTEHGQRVSGTPLGRAPRVTGNEPGSGLAVSGTPYAGREQLSGACASCGCGCCASKQAAPAAPEIPAAPPSHPRYQVPADRPRPMAEAMVQRPPRPEDFSIASPAREALNRITGSAYGGVGRITGPVNMATGLVSGTPEFRYRDEADFAPVAPAPHAAAETAAPGTRITGEGRDGGTRITGDDWARGGQVTGTEGRWAQGRNLTLRGENRAMATGAWANKALERPEVPVARVTGSSGNAGKGALITVSGGARG